MGRRCTIIGGIKLWLPLPYRFDSTYAKFILCPINYAMLLTISPNEKTTIGTKYIYKGSGAEALVTHKTAAAAYHCSNSLLCLCKGGTAVDCYHYSSKSFRKNWQETVTWIIFIIVFGYQIKADTTKNIISSPFLGHRGGHGNSGGAPSVPALCWRSSDSEQENPQKRFQKTSQTWSRPTSVKCLNYGECYGVMVIASKRQSTHKAKTKEL